MSDNTTQAAVGSSAEFGLELEDALQRYWDAAYAEGMDGRDHDTEDSLAGTALRDVLLAVNAMAAAERERCAKPVPDEWLVKVRRLVQGFEHVSGIARLWEPDHSSGIERALWARATEACADVAKLLRDADGPN